MGASTAKGSSGGGGGSYGGGERDRNEQKNVVNKVKVKTAASKAKNKALASGNTMYGGAVSKGIDDALVKSKNVKVGSYFKKVGGEFIRLDAAEGKRLYNRGDPSVSRSVIGNKTSANLKYGSGGVSTAMGTGDPSGALTSTKISSDMLKSQNKTKALLFGGASAMMGPIGTPLRLAAGKAAADYLQPEEAYADYTKGFEAKQMGKKFTSDRTILGILGLKGNKKNKLGQ